MALSTSVPQMKTLLTSCLAVATLSLSASFAYANPALDNTRKNIEPLLGGVPVEAINKSNFAGLYEVVTPQGIIYTDDKGSFVIFNGTVVDSQTKENLTQKRIDQLGAFKFTDLPLKDAIKTVYGNGKRVIATFEDPNCGYCKKLHSELGQLNNVTVYTFLYPILSPDSTAKSKAIWCSANKTKAWNDFMALGKEPVAKSDCATPIERNKALAQKLRVNGTPGIFFASNKRVPGYAPAAEIEKMLVSSK